MSIHITNIAQAITRSKAKKYFIVAIILSLLAPLNMYIFKDDPNAEQEAQKVEEAVIKGVTGIDVNM